MEETPLIEFLVAPCDIDPDIGIFLIIIKNINIEIDIDIDIYIDNCINICIFTKIYIDIDIDTEVDIEIDIDTINADATTMNSVYACFQDLSYQVLE